MSVSFSKVNFTRMKTALAKIEPHQAHLNLYDKFQGLLNKLGIRCTLSERQTAEGIFGPLAEVKEREILSSPKYLYRAEAAIDLTSEIVEILKLKQALPKKELEIVKLVTSVFERLTLVKDPLMKKISDNDLEDIGNLIIEASIPSATLKGPVKIDAKKVESLILRLNTFFDTFSKITIPEEYLPAESASELSIDGPICLNISRLLSALTQSLIEKGPVEDLLNDLLEELKHLRGLIHLVLLEENEILQDINGLIEDLSSLVD